MCVILFTYHISYLDIQSRLQYQIQVFCFHNTVIVISLKKNSAAESARAILILSNYRKN